MAVEGLKIVIDADISGAIGAISDLNAALGSIAKTSISVGASINTIDPAKFKALEDKIKSLEVEIIKLNQIISTLNKNKPFSDLPAASEKAAKGIGKVKDASKSGASALLDINRVIQDSAFGFVSIQNNITQLPQSFRALSQAAKDSGQSVSRVLFQTLLGPAGIGTALSVITSALTFASVGFGAWTRGFTSSSEAAKKATATLDEYSKLVQGVSGEVGKSASRITTLVNALQSDSLNTSQRKKALEELKSQNQEFFGSLSEEKGLINGLQAAYDGYLERIKAIATAKAIETQLTKLFDKKLELELNVDPKFNAAVSPETQRLIGTLQKQLDKLGGKVDVKANQDLSKINDNLRQRLSLQTRINNLRAENIVDLSGTREQIEDLERRIKGLSELQKSTGNFDVGGSAAKTKKENDGLEKQLALLEKIRDERLVNLGQLFDLKEIDAATDKLAILEQKIGDLKLQIALRDAKKSGLPAEEVEKLKESVKENTKKALNDLFLKEAILLEHSPKIKFSQPIKVEIPSNINFFTTNTGGTDFNINDAVSKATGFDKKIPTLTVQEVRVKLLKIKINDKLSLGEFVNKVEELNKQLIEQVRGIFENGFSDVFAEIGEGFGEAVASADFGSALEKAAQNILGIVGNVMQQLGKALIGAAIKIKLLKETFEKWAIANPGLAIIAGIGLVAAGAALKNIKFDGPKFAEGGIVSGPTIGQVGERFRPEIILPLDRLPQLFKQIGGDTGGGMQLIPIINNEGLYLAMKRGERSAGRKF